jgi:hypothetical protein
MASICTNVLHFVLPYRRKGIYAPKKLFLLLNSKYIHDNAIVYTKFSRGRATHRPF